MISTEKKKKKYSFLVLKILQLSQNTIFDVLACNIVEHNILNTCANRNLPLRLTFKVIAVGQQQDGTL